MDVDCESSGLLMLADISRIDNRKQTLPEKVERELTERERDGREREFHLIFLFGWWMFDEEDYRIPVKF